MRKLIESSRYLALISVVTLLGIALATMLWSVYKAYLAIVALVSGASTSAEIVLMLIQLLDNFLIAIAFHIFAVSIYELFIGELNLPDWMLAHNLHELKAKLSSLVVLVLGVKFLDAVVQGKQALDLLYTGLAIAVVSAVLIAFGQFGGKD